MLTFGNPAAEIHSLALHIRRDQPDRTSAARHFDLELDLSHRVGRQLQRLAAVNQLHALRELQLCAKLASGGRVVGHSQLEFL